MPVPCLLSTDAQPRWKKWMEVCLCHERLLTDDQKCSESINAGVRVYAVRSNPWPSPPSQTIPFKEFARLTTLHGNQNRQSMAFQESYVPDSSQSIPAFLVKQEGPFSVGIEIQR